MKHNSRDTAGRTRERPTQILTIQKQKRLSGSRANGSTPLAVGFRGGWDGHSPRKLHTPEIAIQKAKQ